MTYRHSRIVDWAKGAVIILWFFSAPFLFVYGLILMGMPSGEQISSTGMLYGLFFVGTWFWSFYWVYGALFKLAEARCPQNALRVRQIKETTDMVLRFLIFAPWGK